MVDEHRNLSPTSAMPMPNGNAMVVCSAKLKF